MTDFRCLLPVIDQCLRCGLRLAVSKLHKAIDTRGGVFESKM